MSLNLNMMDLIRERPNTVVSLTAGDLGQFARQLVASAKLAYEHQQKDDARNTDEYLSTEEVKSVLKVSDSTLYRHAKAGFLHPTWVGGQRRWSKQDIEQYLHDRR